MSQLNGDNYNEERKEGRKKQEKEIIHSRRAVRELAMLARKKEKKKNQVALSLSKRRQFYVYVCWCKSPRVLYVVFLSVVNN